MEIRFQPITPNQIYEVMHKAVIGQDEPLKTVASVISAHLARCAYNQHTNKKIQKDNLLIVGPTGTGKTECIRTALRELKLPIPMAVVPVNTLSTAGYRGRQVEDMIQDLVRDTRRVLADCIESYIFSENEYQIVEKDNGSKVKRINPEALEQAIIKLCENGIIVLDEIDKIHFDPVNEYEGVYKRNMQFELLKIIEGTKGLSEDCLVQKIDTSNILFICLGAFTKLLNPPPGRPEIGFSDNKFSKEISNNNIPSTEDLVKFGFVEEFIGRIPLRCRFNALSVDNLYKILTESSISPVEDFKNLFAIRKGNTLSFTDDALHEIAKRAATVNTGARGLRTVMHFLYDIYFNTESSCIMDEVIIHANTVNGSEPEIRRIGFNELLHNKKNQPVKTGIKNNDFNGLNPVEIE
ncbi:MAG: AAA family ATPase [Acidaminococcaceae bacterium]|nr:AAA family ATPase [Acidaminococcaceae bacterium]